MSLCLQYVMPYDTETHFSHFVIIQLQEIQKLSNMIKEYWVLDPGQFSMQKGPKMF